MTQRTLSVCDGGEFLIAFSQGINCRQICWCFQSRRDFLTHSTSLLFHFSTWALPYEWKISRAIGRALPSCVLVCMLGRMQHSRMNPMCAYLAESIGAKGSSRGLKMRPDVPGLLLISGQNLYCWTLLQVLCQKQGLVDMDWTLSLARNCSLDLCLPRAKRFETWTFSFFYSQKKCFLGILASFLPEQSFWTSSSCKK